MLALDEFELDVGLNFGNGCVGSEFRLESFYELFPIFNWSVECDSLEFEINIDLLAFWLIRCELCLSSESTPSSASLISSNFAAIALIPPVTSLANLYVRFIFSAVEIGESRTAFTSSNIIFGFRVLYPFTEGDSCFSLFVPDDF